MPEQHIYAQSQYAECESFFSTSQGNDMDMRLQLRELRNRSNMTQLELSIRSGLSQSWLSRAERGEVQVTIPTLSVLSAALECSVEELLGLTDTDPQLSNLLRVARRLSPEALQLLIERAKAFADLGMTK